MKFKIGQRVRLISHDWSAVSYGETGIVRDVEEYSEPPIGVEWDAYNSLRHRLEICSTYHCLKGHGWYVYDQDLEIIPTDILKIEELI